MSHRDPIVCAALLAVVIPTLVSPAARAQGAAFQLAFDEADQALNGGEGYKAQDASYAWGESYVLMSYATMFRATGDARYLERLADHALHVLGRRDSALGLKDYAGKSRPCWQSTRYSAAGQPYCWVVHSGMIAAPIAELAALVKAHPEVRGRAVASLGGQTLEQLAQQVVTEVQATVATHDFQYQAGPGSGEGHYRGDPAATAVVPNVAGKALPLNQMNAMGRALLLLWQATGEVAHRDRAKALATYLRNRMSVSGAARVWTYSGAAWSAGKGEDISHAAINVDFAARCAAAKLVFSAADLRAIGRTLFEKVHVDADTVSDLLDGGGGTNQYKLQIGRWLGVAPYEPRAWPVVANIFRGVSAGGGPVLLGLAQLALHAPPLTGYDFYQTDWADRGDHRQATAHGANLLIVPPAAAQPAVLRVGYRAARPAWVDQWDGKAYHHGVRLPATSGFVPAYAPYDPALHFEYGGGGKVLYQLTDTFVDGAGIEVQELPAVVLPAIGTAALPAAEAGQPYGATVEGTGDAPLVWRLVEGPPGMTIGLQSGELAWPAATAALARVVIALRNDSGEARRTYAIELAGSTPAGDAPAATQDGGLAPGDQGVAPAGDGSPDDAAQGGCACALGRSSGPPLLWLLLGALALPRRRGGAVRRSRARLREPLNITYPFVLR